MDTTHAKPAGTRSTTVTWRDLDQAADIDALGCLSTELPWNSNWYDRQFLIPHEPVRFNLLQLERVVQPQYFEPVRAWKVHRLFHWYNKYFLEPVHHHHDAEERIFFPFVLGKPGIVLPERMANDHKGLLQMMDDIKSMEKKFDMAMLSNDRQLLTALASELRTAVHALADDMREHLAEEEKIIPPILKAHFTEAEADKTVQRIMKEIGPDIIDMAPDFIHSQFRVGGTDAVNSFLAKVPPPLRWWYRKFGHTWYEAEPLAIIQSLTVDSDAVVPLPKPRGFWVFRRYRLDRLPEYVKQAKKGGAPISVNVTTASA